MRMRDTGFAAVVLGGDMNCYGVARTFYEAYGIRTVIAGKVPIFPTAESRLVERYYDENILEDDALINVMRKICDDHPGLRLIILASNDDYVRHVIHNRSRIENISSNFIIPMISEELFDRLDDKDTFYELCGKYGLPYPSSAVFDCASDDIDIFEIPFGFPIFIKPASNVVYFNLEFEGKQKGYRIESHEELRDVMNRITGAGYRDRFIFQEYIEGGDDSMYIYSVYCDRYGRARMTSGGRILMHDRTPELIGNYNAITGARDDRLTDRLCSFLEKIGFTGICHFDIQYDARRGDYVVYEINIRQGRSNYYMTASGMNYARLLVADYIEDAYSSLPDPAPGYTVADRPFIVSNVSRTSLAKAIGRQAVRRVPARSFYRFQLAPYDPGIRNTLYMLRLERSIMKNYFRYNTSD